MGLKVVTYEGSDNPGETVILVGSSRLNRGTPTAIPDADAAALKDVEGHDFKVSTATVPKDAEHGSIVVDGKVVGTVRQPAHSRADAEEAAEAAAEAEPETAATS